MSGIVSPMKADYSSHNTLWKLLPSVYLASNYRNIWPFIGGPTSLALVTGHGWLYMNVALNIHSISSENINYAVITLEEQMGVMSILELGENITEDIFTL